MYSAGCRLAPVAVSVKEGGASYAHYRSDSMERTYGSFARLVPLPCEVDTSKVEAVFQKGVLTVTLPKAAKAQARRRIAIRAQ